MAGLQLPRVGTEEKTDRLRCLEIHDTGIGIPQDKLQAIFELFQQGDYTDPSTLHGANMPGLKELQAGASHIKVTYAALPAGAEITFETTDLHLMTAIHRWFGAQLSEHGADSRSE